MFESTTSQIMPDKNWMVVNDYAGTPNAGRLVVTWTNFTASNSEEEGGNLLGAYSDDRGVTWSSPSAITPAGSSNQGTQPIFLPDGSLLVVYITFTSTTDATAFAIACKHSLDGGRTFPSQATTLVPAVAGWDDPDLRDGVFLPSATVARQSGAVYVAYTAVVSGTPRVLVTRSTDSGNSWSQPMIASDNPTGSGVVNPAVAVTPDGQSVSVAFIDKRNAADGHNFIDIYAAQSFNAGQSWQPNLRLTELTTDIRNGPLTTRGYMFGDYMAVAPALAPDEPCVAIWCDTRTGDSDPFTVRFTPAATATYDAWRTARFNPGDTQGSSTSDPDADGYDNALEFTLGTDPRVAEGGEPVVLQAASSNVTNAAVAVRTDSESLVSVQPVDPVSLTPSSAYTVNRDDSVVPSVDAGTGLHWVGFSIAGPSAATVRVETSAPPGATAGGVSPDISSVGGVGRLINVSSRAAVGTGADALIVGFAIDGQKSMLVRGAGPALSAFGLPDAVALPQLQLTTVPAGTSALATNTQWDAAATPNALFAGLGAFPFPVGSSDTAILQTLPVGTYSGVMTGLGGTTGPALVEAYDADPQPGAPDRPRILNLSTRAKVGAGSSTLIAGFVISGARRQVLLRAIGPSLGAFNVTGAMTDPVLTLYPVGSSVPLASNDDWTASRSAAAITATAARVGAFALNSTGRDAALLITLDPGGYTVTVTGASDTSGIALVEVYDAE